MTTSTVTPADTHTHAQTPAIFHTGPRDTAAELTDVELSRVQIDVEEPSGVCAEPEPHSQTHQTEAHQLKHIHIIRNTED